MSKQSVLDAVTIVPFDVTLTEQQFELFCDLINYDGYYAFIATQHGCVVKTSEMNDTVREWILTKYQDTLMGVQSVYKQ